MSSDAIGSSRPDSLFARVVGETGLASIIAQGTVRRALADVGATPKTAGGATYIRALPALTARLAAFLPANEVVAARQRIRKVIETGNGPGPQ